jgi:hypothetical protein
MSDMTDNQTSPPVDVALCVDTDALDRFGSVLRHLLVGLVDEAVKLRLVSRDARVEALRLGPVQTVLHERIGWPVSARRLEALIDVLSQRPPTIAHAMSGGSYGVASAVAETFGAELVMQVTSLADCDAILKLPAGRVGRFIALSEPLSRVLCKQLGIPEDRVAVARPGVVASQEAAAFSRPDRVPSILCLSALERNSGVERLVDALKLLRDRGQRFMLFLLGEGRRESWLRRTVRDYQLSGHVTFAHPSGDPSKAMYSADILVRPSADTSFHADAIQAMGAGIVVVTVTGTVYDHLRDSQTAIVCERPTARALADAIDRLLTDQVWAAKLAAQGQAYVRTHHSASQAAETVAQTYRQILSARAPAPDVEEAS